MKPTLSIATLITIAATALASGCPGDDDVGLNPPKLWLKATEIVGTIELVPVEPEPY
jgi:hypothetical protein